MSTRIIYVLKIVHSKALHFIMNTAFRFASIQTKMSFQENIQFHSMDVDKPGSESHTAKIPNNEYERYTVSLYGQQ
jgi:hypothetical protein